MSWLERVGVAERPVDPPVAIDISPNRALSISWADGGVSEIPFLDLRDGCPCAACIEEGSGKKMVERTKISPDIAPDSLEPVGRYAIKIGWSDGPITGIYSWTLLRELAGP